MSLTASSAALLVSFVVDPPMYASTACVSASSPVEAVSEGGRVRVVSGSRTAYRGMSGNELIGYLCLVLLSTMTAASVVSLPVPAVVGTATRRGILFSTLSMPSIFSSGFLGYAILAPTAFAASMDDPPPNPMIAWHPDALKSAAASSTLSVVGFATVAS